MRIVSGAHKGRRIVTPKNLPVRPTTDMAKEALFNVLNNYFELENLKILDLFSGTGNMSYEFASRGCGSITSVDQHQACVAFIQKTANELEFPIQVIKKNVFDFLKQKGQKFDIIFADPPYDLAQEDFEKLVIDIYENEYLDEAGMLIVEHSKFTKLEHLMHYSFAKKYGNTTFSFFEIASFDDEPIHESEED